MGKVLLSIWRFIVETFIKKMARRISFFYGNQSAV